MRRPLGAITWYVYRPMTAVTGQAPATPSPQAHQVRATVLGLVSILLWSNTFAVNTNLNATIGTLWSGALSYLAAGMIGLALLVRQGRVRTVLALPRRYLWGCGLLFALYSVPLFVALQYSRDTQQAIAVSLVNYLWPALILALSVPVLGAQARWSLPLGLVAATAGVALVLYGRAPGSGDAAAGAGERLWPYALMLVGAVCWALFSLFTRRLLPTRSGAASGAVPLFFLSSGALLLVLALGHGVKPEAWSPRVFAEIAFLALFPCWLAYTFWDVAMRGGDMVLVTAASYFTPLLSTLFSCLYLGVPMGGRLWLGCALLIVGAAVCKLSVREQPIKESAT